MAKVVVVEDDVALRGIIADELKDLGHTVHVASDGESGLEVIGREHPDVVCCDINMPRMNGFQMKSKLQDSGILDEKAIFVFISAKTAKSDVADGLMLGADHYFTKPIDFEKLARVIANR